MPDGVIAQIGHGACPWPVRFAFALDAQTELPAGHAVVFDSRAPITLDRHAVWLR